MRINADPDPQPCQNFFIQITKLCTLPVRKTARRSQIVGSFIQCHNSQGCLPVPSLVYLVKKLYQYYEYHRENEKIRETVLIRGRKSHGTLPLSQFFFIKKLDFENCGKNEKSANIKLTFPWYELLANLHSSYLKVNIKMGIVLVVLVVLDQKSHSFVHPKNVCPAIWCTYLVFFVRG